MFQKDDEEFFIKMADYCLKEGIELVVVSTPIPAETYEAGKEHFDSAYAHMAGLAEDIRRRIGSGKQIHSA